MLHEYTKDLQYANAKVLLSMRKVLHFEMSKSYILMRQSVHQKNVTVLHISQKVLHCAIHQVLHVISKVVQEKNYSGTQIDERPTICKYQSAPFNV